MEYTSQPCEEVMALRSAVSYTPYATSLRGETDGIFTFEKFEEGDLSSETQHLLSETCDDTESGNKSDEISTIPQLISA